VSGERAFRSIKVHFKGALGSVKYEPAVFARLEMFAERVRSLGGKCSLEVITDRSNSCSASHSNPQGLDTFGINWSKQNTNS